MGESVDSNGIAPEEAMNAKKGMMHWMQQSRGRMDNPVGLLAKWRQIGSPPQRRPWEREEGSSGN